MERKGFAQNIYGTPFGDNPIIPAMGIGSRIKKLRLDRGLDQGELARAAKIAQSTLSDLERGDSQGPRGDTLVRLAAVLQVDQEWLMTGDGTPAPKVSPHRDEAQILSMYRAMTDANKAVLVATAKALLDSQPPGPEDPTHHPRPRRQQ